MTKNLLNNKIKKCAALIAVGIVFVLYLLMWFKQYTYFNYSGGEDHFDDAELTAYASTAVEKSFELDPGYPTKAGRIIFWTNKFSDISIVNESSDTWQFTVSDYYGGDVPAVPDPVILQSGEEYSFAADGRSGYVVTAYGRTADESVEGLCVRYGSHAYMGRWKKATIIALGLMAVILLLLCLWALASTDSFHKVAPYVCLSLGGLSFIVSECTGIAGTESYLTALPQMGAVYLGVLALIAAHREPSQYGPDDHKASGATEKPATAACKLSCPYFWIIISAAIAFTLHFFMLSSSAGSPLYAFTGGENSGRRIAGYIVVFGVFLLLYLCLGHIKLPAKMIETIRSYFSGKAALLSAMLCILAICRTWLRLHPVFIVAFVLVILGIRYGHKIKIPKAVRIIYYLLLSVLVAANSCVINFWDTGSWVDVYHTGTFYNSIFFVAAGQPFRGGLSQMYGHFSLFYKIPMLIFGSNMRTVGVTTAVFAGVTVLLALLAMDRILKSDISRILSGIVVIAYFIIDILYLQTFPLRMLWAFALLYYCAFIKDKQLTTLWRLLGYLICTVAIFWNTESGLVCAVCWAVCIVMHSEKKLTIKRLILEGAVEVVIVVAELFIAYSAVKLYNICTMSSGSSLAEFLSWKKELATSARSDAGDTSNGALYWVNAPWMYIELVLMGGVAVLLDKAGFFRNRRYGNDDLPRTMLVFYAAGIFIYWLGRPESYNPISPYIGCILMIIYDGLVVMDLGNASGSDEKWAPVSKLSSFDFNYNLRIAVSVIACIALAGFLFKIPDLLKNTKHNLIDCSITDYGKVEKYLEDFANEIPEAADGEAVGLRMICMSLGRDIECDGLGWGYDEEAFEEKCRKMEWVILDTDSPDMPFLELEKVVHFGTMEYYLYHNTDYTPIFTH